MSLRVAVIGAGFMGRLHARVLAESPLAELAAIVDVDQETGPRIASEFGVRWSSSVDSVYEDPSIDAAIVAVPDTAHEEPSCRLLLAGKAVLLEKPMAHSLDVAQRIAHAARSSESRLMVAHILRFDPRYVGAAASVAAGAIGRPLHIAASRFTLRQVGDRLAGKSSPCFYLGIHDIDAVQWVSARGITRVFALAAGDPTEDAVFVTCELQGGLVGSLQFGWTLPDHAPSSINARLEVVGTQGAVEVDTRDHGLRVLDTSRFSLPDALHWPDVNNRITGDLKEEVDHFLSAISTDQEFVVSLDDAMRNVAVNDAIRRSLRSNAFAPVEVVAT